MVVMDDVELPTYYIVNRDLTPEQAQVVFCALRITPIFCAIISDLKDTPLAFGLANEVIHTSTDDDAHILAWKVWTDTSKSSLVIGNANFLDAVYSDGHKEEVVTQC